MDDFEIRKAAPVSDCQSASAVDTRREPAVRSDQTAKTIGLCMIVKNEAHVILRCLESVRPLIDHVVIEDTGSTDGTQQIIRAWLWRENLRGVVIEEPWRDFGYNRSHALAKLRELTNIDYALVIDADDVLMFGPELRVDEFKRSLVKDYYNVDILHGSVIYQRALLCRNSMLFVFLGIVHEYLHCQDGLPSLGHINDLSIRYNHDGARSLDPETNLKDAQLMERAMSTESDALIRSRYAFHLAQSYEACGDLQKALHYYLLRSDMDMGCQVDEEVYVCLVKAGRIKEALRFDFYDIIANYKRAMDVVPTRAEAIHGISRIFRIIGRNKEGYEVAKSALDLSVPRWLFIGSWIYEYGLLDEIAINAGCVGEYQESLSYSLRILETNKIPPDERPRIIANARLALSRLRSGGADKIAVYDDLLTRFGAATDSPLLELVGDTLFSRGVALSGLGREEDAIAAYDDVLSRFASAIELPLRELVANALVNKGIMLSAIGRGEEAIAAYDDLLTRFNEATGLPLRELELVANALFNKGATLGALGRGEAAIAAYDDLIACFGAATGSPLRELVAKALVNRERTDSLGFPETRRS